MLQENVLAESAMMIPETRQRLETAFNDLQAYLVRRVNAKLHWMCCLMHPAYILQCAAAPELEVPPWCINTLAAAPEQLLLHSPHKAPLFQCFGQSPSGATDKTTNHLMRLLMHSHVCMLRLSYSGMR